MKTRNSDHKIPVLLLEKVATLPDLPGIYQFVDSGGVLIYVGKAKNLRKRVSSYFHKTPDNAKTALMIRKIHEINTVVVDNESEALLLENNLIKEHQPRYNVLMRDDKTFPWICIRNEPFPRVFTTRKMIRDGSRYYGPFTSGKIWKNLVDLIRSLYRIRTCSLNLSSAQIAAGKYRVCLEYHIGNCLGPCVGLQKELHYMEQVQQIEGILKGNTIGVIRRLREQMKRLSDDYQFERAAELKERIEMLERFQAKSAVVSQTIRHVDVFSIVSDERSAWVNYLKILNGALVQAHSIELSKKLDESDAELMSIAITEIRSLVQSDASEILVSVMPEFTPAQMKVKVPQRGEKRTLVALSLRNAHHFRLERQKELMRQNPAQRIERKLFQLQKDLRMSVMPERIECFDNSNIQGSHPVAACVVFVRGMPEKKAYRHFNIRTVIGPDDYASMEEVILRRYRRMLDEGSPLPDLVIVDGGKGQLAAALKSFEQLGIRGKTAVIGIAKRLEEIYFPNDPVPLYLDKNSESLRLIQQIRNEAHRFGIGHHRKRREKSQTSSSLENISGIGTKTIERLFTAFGGISGIQKAPPEKVSELIGPVKARMVLDAILETNSENHGRIPE